MGARLSCCTMRAQGAEKDEEVDAPKFACPRHPGKIPAERRQQRYCQLTALQDQMRFRTKCLKLRMSTANSRVAHIRVVNALSGEQMLAETAMPCDEIPGHVRAALGSRPSRPVTLFHNGCLVNDFRAAPGERVELTATVAEALTAEDRAQFLQALAKARWPELGADGSVFFSCRRRFRAFPEAARDDAELVLAAVRRDGGCLRFASWRCRSDKQIVHAAVQQDGFALECAALVCKHDRELVLEAAEQLDRAIAAMHSQVHAASKS